MEAELLPAEPRLFVWIGERRPGEVLADVEILDQRQKPVVRVRREQGALRASTHGPQRRVLDLSAVTFMDSSAINVLVLANRDANATGGWLRMAGLTEPARREIVGLDTVIPCYSTLTQALAA
ncbi:STAS domain-containing protein [Streptomyces sp. NPDC059371]|uniref:STAS domain-containing protein n=1 Tax=Streptomyces sp. NPDC059371 TaxID=3346812 RepID=UPI00369CC01D